MTIKFKSNVKELMAAKGLSIPELREKTGLPHIAILNACSDKIEDTGLSVLSKIASAMNVSIKDSFDEINPKQKKKKTQRTQRTQRIMTGETNISSVTNQLINLIMKMSTIDKDKLLEKYNELKESPPMKSDASNVTTNLVKLIMTMSLEDRCQLLGDFISYNGTSKRKYTRNEYLRPVPFTVNGKLYHGDTKNISVGGVFIEVKDAGNQFAAGDTIKINLEHPETYLHSNINGKIVRISKAGIGVCFDESL